MDTGSHKAVFAAMLANAGIAAAKFVGFFFTGATSMLAEAVHSVADTGNQLLLLWGNAAARRDATATHAFGYGRERYFWSFVVALVIFSLGGLFAVYEGVTKFFHPHPLTQIWWAIGILGVSVVLEAFSFRTAIGEALLQKGAVSWWSFVRDTKNPELPVVLMEDFGALIGLVLALLGVGMTAITGDARFDALGSVAIGVLLVSIGVGLSIKMKALLIGESATQDNERAIRSAIADSPEVRRLIHMRTQHIGPEEILLGAKLEFDPGYTLNQLADAIDAVEARIRQRVPATTIIFLEPDFFCEKYVER